MNTEKIIASFSCVQCKKGKFLILQIENELNIVCTNCAYITNIEETWEQLKQAKKELEKK